MLFLLDSKTLLRIYYENTINYNLGRLAQIGYGLFEIDKCNTKVYKKDVYRGDAYYCDRTMMKEIHLDYIMVKN